MGVALLLLVLRKDKPARLPWRWRSQRERRCLLAFTDRLRDGLWKRCRAFLK